MKDDIKILAKKYLSEIIDIRRELHQFPELAFEEEETARRITQFLDFHEIEYTEKIAKTGIVGIIEGKNPHKKVIALRADMDALPITETNNISYKSMNVGKMHACGHDVHMASLLGTLAILNQLKDKFEGTIKFLFQPSEEQYPGGASVMIAEGVLENPSPQCIFGQHVYPELKAGQIGFRSGKYMASTDEVFITVKGKGGHAALPQTLVDPILIASHIVIAMQQIVSRYALPTIPTVISFGKIIGNGKTNVIPDNVHLEGIIRTFDEDWREEINKKINKIAKSIAQGMGGDCEVRINTGYPLVYNDLELTNRAKNAAEFFLGKEQVFDLDMRMTAEDFAFYTQIIPGCFYRLGVASPDAEEVLNLHSSTFNIDENSIETGIGLMAWLALDELKHT
ncbi:MAG: M20 family metallopeptidase [Bacteroidales bacterium]|jgi:amidohydrolase|nr:M20 family metallopeptidase [Bacteroidales bacterium]